MNHNTYSIARSLRYHGGMLYIDGALVHEGVHIPDGLYEQLAISYPKFFKMDLVSKWAFVTSEALLNHNGNAYEGIDKTQIAVVLHTHSGCIDVDKKYRQSIDTHASPALFVYTLPNIMLGEVSIRHGFKGEQLSMVDAGFDASALYQSVADMMPYSGMQACLCGWVDATESGADVCLFFVTNSSKGAAFTEDAIQQVYNSTTILS